MNVTYLCPGCERTVRSPVDPDVHAVVCSRCAHQIPFAKDAIQHGRVRKCLICPCRELFVRKNFNQRLGFWIIVVGFIASSVAWYFRMKYWTYGILFATALIDVILYLFVGNLLQCYRCTSEYRDVDGLDDEEVFSLETHERYRQEQARLDESLKQQRSNLGS